LAIACTAVIDIRLMASSDTFEPAANARVCAVRPARRRYRTGANSAQQSMVWPAAAPGAGAQCTRTQSPTSTASTAPHGTRWSRTGFFTTRPASEAMTRGRNAQA